MLATVLWAIIAGAILGVIGRMILPGRQNIPIWATIGAGIIAAFAGGALAEWMGVGDTDGIDWIKHFIQIVLAVIAIWAVAAIMGRSSRQQSSR